MPSDDEVRARREDLPDDMPTVTDPHHNGANEWGYAKGSLWHHPKHSNWWQEANGFSFTPARLHAIATIVPNPEAPEDPDRGVVRGLKSAEKRKKGEKSDG